MDRYNEDKIEHGIKNIENLTSELRYSSYDELKEKLWRLEREATLLKEFVDQQLMEEEYREVI
ncbi:MAG: hypothetical protein JW995_04780 [Melioribacteraceae bacterium]|nr:hypothetical protein [Melioribacteraceae bacterium]